MDDMAELERIFRDNPLAAGDPEEMERILNSKRPKKKRNVPGL